MRVVVNGVFDLLHVGHLRLLETAKARFGWVLVAVDSDRFCEEQKRRPIIPCDQRVEMLRGLRSVDEVCVADWDFGPYCRDPSRIDSFMLQYRLDAVFCGCDDPAYIERWFSYLAGLGRVQSVPRTPDISTSTIIHDVLAFAGQV